MHQITNSGLVPMVIEQTPRGERSFDIYSRLLSLSEGPQQLQTDSLEQQEMKKEEFWREMDHSDDPFETICFFISKGYLDNV